MPNNKPKTTAMKILCFNSLCSQNSQRPIVLYAYIYIYVSSLGWFVFFFMHGFFLNSHGVVFRRGWSEQQPLNLKSSKSVALEPSKPPSKKYKEQRANGRNTTLTGSHAVRKLLMPESFVLPFKHVATVSTNNFHQSKVCPPLALGCPVQLVVQELLYKFLRQKLAVCPRRLVPFLRPKTWNPLPGHKHPADRPANLYAARSRRAFASTAPVPLNNVLSPSYLYRHPPKRAKHLEVHPWLVRFNYLRLSVGGPIWDHSPLPKGFKHFLNFTPTLWRG